MEIFIRVGNEKITKARFLTDGCMTTIVSATDKTISEAMEVSQELILEKLGGLPEASQHCALLAANTLKAALEDYLRTKNEPWKRLYRRS